MIAAIFTCGPMPILAQMAPRDLWGEKPAHCHAWLQNLGQLLGTDGVQAPSKITHYQRGVVADIYLDDRGTASFAWSSNDLDTTTSDTTYRIDMYPADSSALTPSIHEFNPFPGRSNYYKGALPGEVEGVESIGDVVWHHAFTNVDLSWSSNKVGTKLYITLYPGADPDNVIFSSSVAIASTSIGKGG
ncbi:MAG: hypothetical protein IPI81_02240 [Flavobacteriales bacterium]|nr:hypothetical protein [Flavobacteriales bacterium]